MRVKGSASFHLGCQTMFPLSNQNYDEDQVIDLLDYPRHKFQLFPHVCRARRSCRSQSVLGLGGGGEQLRRRDRTWEQTLLN